MLAHIREPEGGTMSYAEGLLATDERILREERQHWMFPLLVAGRWVAIAIGIALAGFVLVQFVLNPSGEGGIVDSTVSLVQNVVGLLTWLALAFAVIGLVWSTVRWQSQEYVLTDRRVMHIFGVINKQALDSSLENITDAQIRVPWLGRVMGYGNLTLMTPAESGINELQLLKSPIEFKRDMMDAKNSRLIDINTPRFTSPPIHAPTAGAAEPAPTAAPVAAQAAPAPAAATVPAPTAPAAAQMPDAATAAIPLAAEDEAAGWMGGPAPVETPTAPATPPTGSAPASSAPSPEDTTKTLAALADLRDRGAITPEEYEAKKAELLERL
jgi:hypothetical protein